MCQARAVLSVRRYSHYKAEWSAICIFGPLGGPVWDHQNELDRGLPSDKCCPGLLSDREKLRLQTTLRSSAFQAAQSIHRIAPLCIGVNA